MPRNPFQYLLPVAPAAFVGRWPLVNQMARDLTQDGGDSHALIAGRRCGKSSLLIALAHDLRQGWARPDGADWLALPLNFDFKAAAFPSVEAFFARILSELRRRVDTNTRRRPADAWPTPVRLEADWFTALAAQPILTLRDFEDAVGYLLDQLATPQATVRLVLLLDEVDETLDEPWMTALFNQLRALIYSSDLRDRVRLLLAGSRRFLDQVSDRGSPLWNVLKLHYLTSFDRAGFDQFTPRWSELPPPAFDSVWQQSGGHPFLAQYLLHHAWETAASATIDQNTPALLTQLVQRFSTEQAQDLQGWVNGVEIIGLRVYNTLPQPPLGSPKLRSPPTSPTPPWKSNVASPPSATTASPSTTTGPATSPPATSSAPGSPTTAHPCSSPRPYQLRPRRPPFPSKSSSNRLSATTSPRPARQQRPLSLIPRTTPDGSAKLSAAIKCILSPMINNSRADAPSSRRSPS